MITPELGGVGRGAGWLAQRQRIASWDERLRLVARLLEGETMASLCEESAISRTTGDKVYEGRFLDRVQLERLVEAIEQPGVLDEDCGRVRRATGPFRSPSALPTNSG